MALQKATQSIPFTQGVDTKNDQKLTAKPSRMENRVFRTGTVQKRYGRIPLASNIDTGGNQTTGEALFTANNELVRINGGTTYGLANASPEWVTKTGGSHYSVVSKAQLVRNTSTQGLYDVAVVNAVGVIAWTDSTGAAFVSVYDLATGVFYQTAVRLGAASSMRCVALGTSVVILTVSGGNVLSTAINTAAPSTPPASLAIIKSDAANPFITFDAFAYNSSYAVLVYPNAAGALTTLNVCAVGPTGAVLASPATTTTTTLTGASGLTAGLLTNRDTAGNVYLVYGDSSVAKTRFTVLSSTFANVVSPTDIVTSGNWSGGSALMYTAASVQLVANQLTVVMTSFQTVNFGPNYTAFLGKVVLGPAGIVSAFSELASTQGMFVTNDFTAFDGTYVFGAVNLSQNAAALRFQTPGFSDAQTSAFILDPNGQEVARALNSSSGYANFSGGFIRVCRSYTIGQSATLPFSEQGRLAFVTEQNTQPVNVAPLGISAITLTRTSAGLLPVNRLGQTTYIGGAVPRTYDGQVVVEGAFPLYPIPYSITATGSAGSLTAGTYQWAFVYSWVNASGELVRSIPSTPFSLAVSATNTATIKLLTMAESTRDVLGAKVQVEVYRTIANGTVFYRQSSPSNPSYNVTTYATTTSGFIQLTDGVSDAALQSGELLYTTGGILDWEAPPSYSAACIHQQRLIVVGLENPYQWMPSSQWNLGEQVRFSSFTRGFVPSNTGPLVGCASMDNQLYLFTTQGCYGIAGNGPDQLGNNPYSPPQLVTSVDAGPINAASIVSTPMGIIFQSVKGFMLLDRGLNCTFIGSDVEQFSTGAWVCKAATILPEAQQVRFQLDTGSDLPGQQQGTLVPSMGGVACVYDYHYQQWSTFPQYGAQSSCIYNGNYTMVRSDGVVLAEAPSTFTDSGIPFSSVVETSWIKLAGLQGFQRIYYAILLGTYQSNCTLTWDIAYSYSTQTPAVPIYSESVQLAGNNVFTLGGPFEVRHHLGHSCVSVKFRFTDSAISPSGQGFDLSDLTVEYGVKKGAYKLPAAQTA